MTSFLWDSISSCKQSEQTESVEVFVGFYYMVTVCMYGLLIFIQLKTLSTCWDEFQSSFLLLLFFFRVFNKISVKFSMARCAPLSGSLTSRGLDPDEITTELTLYSTFQMWKITKYAVFHKYCVHRLVSCVFLSVLNAALICQQPLEAGSTS